MLRAFLVDPGLACMLTSPKRAVRIRVRLGLMEAGTALEAAKRPLAALDAHHRSRLRRWIGFQG
ncbi:hypothetical protein [Bradyrhizobium sp. UFLA05-112]